ncbi:hypothetical protein [Methylobacterium sp. J-076]|uniref:hypothetical protein n=1 Tax=Methylobacterium sp. J-076 TaxID=2836655 RepID=UPI001FB8E7A7|nr:hypothetical protein [Methylobacterium sp. J-076]MCJ2012903.1 hypothetical protein [Methylobacterium sp. J-076]
MSQPLHRPNPLGERLAAFGIAALVVATVLVGVFAPDRRESPPRTAADDPACLEWSNGCQVCQRWPEGPACSLPGIACQPGALHCLRHRDG